MKKRILILLIILTALLPAKSKLEDTKWESWDTVEDFCFAAGCTVLSWNIDRNGILGAWYLPFVINYGKESWDWYYYDEFNTKDFISRSLGIIVPYMVMGIAVGHAMGSLDRPELDEFVMLEKFQLGDLKCPSHQITSLEMAISWHRKVLKLN